MIRFKPANLLKIAGLCGCALVIIALPAPRMSAGLEIYSVRMSLSMGAAPVRLRTGASEIGQAHDIRLTVDLGDKR